MIDLTGSNLGILIDCDYKPGHNWMSFAACYSIYKNLPDAQVVVLVRRGVSPFSLFGWCYKFGVPILQYCRDLNKSKLLGNCEKVLKIPPMVMALRGFEEFGTIGPVSVKSEDFSTLVDYSGGCGKFVLSEWIDRPDGPFRFTNRLAAAELTPNELKVFGLWEQMARVFEEAKQ
jgi:hypothetical protein